MTATGHAVIGAVLAAKIGNPYIGIPFAILSHFAADLFPHWDAGTNSHKKSKNRLRIEAVVDVLCSMVVAYSVIFLFFPQTDLIYTFIMIIAAQLMDWLTAPHYMFNMKFFPFSLFEKISETTNTRLDKPWGIINQVAILVILIIVAMMLPNYGK